MKLKAFLVAFGLGLASLPCSVSAGDDPNQWLERMGAAMSQMDYQGTFVYVLGDHVETVRITHMVDEKGSHERLSSVSGLPREVLRDSDGVRWISGDDREVLADADPNRSFFPELPIDSTSEAGASYTFKLNSHKRIAGHSGRQLDIVPRDEYRYGYRLWLETQSGLLLKWELTGLEGEILAKLVFTELKMGSQVDPDELQSGNVKKASASSKPVGSHKGTTSKSPASWKAENLPPGFRLASHRRALTGNQPTYEHLVYSDGIAAVSVYIEPAEETTALDMGLSQWGTTHAFIRAIDGNVVTVLGDVPAATVKRIGNSISPVSP